MNTTREILPILLSREGQAQSATLESVVANVSTDKANRGTLTIPSNPLFTTGTDF